MGEGTAVLFRTEAGIVFCCLVWGLKFYRGFMMA